MIDKRLDRFLKGIRNIKYTNRSFIDRVNIISNQRNFIVAIQMRDTLKTSTQLIKNLTETLWENFLTPIKDTLFYRRSFRRISINHLQY